jgi:hypothetical protein
VLSGSLLAPPPPGVVRLDYKPTPDTFHRLLNLDDNWEVEGIQFNTNTSTVRIDIKETDDFIKNAKSPDCAGKLEVYDHALPQLWTYPDLFGFHTEIESRLPLVKCKEGGPISNFKEELPWEDKARLVH